MVNLLDRVRKDLRRDVRPQILLLEVVKVSRKVIESLLLLMQVATCGADELVP
jgi:hypothetical protein